MSYPFLTAENLAQQHGVDEKTIRRDGRFAAKLEGEDGKGGWKNSPEPKEVRQSSLVGPRRSISFMTVSLLASMKARSSGRSFAVILGTKSASAASSAAMHCGIPVL
jgi:hypothetical protein